MEKFSNYYTTNVDYLKETQKINIQMDKINIDNSLIDKTYNNWNNIKNDEATHGQILQNVHPRTDLLCAFGSGSNHCSFE